MPAPWEGDPPRPPSCSACGTGTLARIKGTLVQDRDLERLKALNDSAVAEFVAKGARVPGTGLPRALATNMLSFWYDDKYMTCGDQSVALLEKIRAEQGGKVGGHPSLSPTQSMSDRLSGPNGRQNATTVFTPDGWKYQVATSGPNHAYVLGIAPDGRLYRVDPWYGEVERLERPPNTTYITGRRG